MRTQCQAVFRPGFNPSPRRPGAAAPSPNSKKSIFRIHYSESRIRIENQSSDSFLPMHTRTYTRPRAREHFLATVSFLSEIN